MFSDFRPKNNYKAIMSRGFTGRRKRERETERGIYIYIYILMYVCIYIYIYMHVYIYIYIYITSRSTVPSGPYLDLMLAGERSAQVRNNECDTPTHAADAACLFVLL